MNKFDILPHSHKCILNFNEWVMWSLRCEVEQNDVVYDFDLDYYGDYKNLRLWCVDLICIKQIPYEDIPEVTHANQNKVFKESRKRLNIKSFKNVDTHDFAIIYNNDKFEAI